MKDKRAKLDLQDLIPVGLVLVVAGILLSFGAQVTGDIRSDLCDTGDFYNSTSGVCQESATNQTTVDGGYDFNISTSSLEGQWNLSNRMPTIGLVAAIVIVIGLLVSGFGYLMGRR